jgi:hypothetical protein
MLLIGVTMQNDCGALSFLSFLPLCPSDGLSAYLFALLHHHQCLLVIARVPAPSTRLWFIRLGTLEHLLLVSTCQELNQMELELVKPHTQTNGPEDLELKLTCWEIIHQLIVEPRCLSRVLQFQFHAALLNHLDPPPMAGTATGPHSPRTRAIPIGTTLTPAGIIPRVKWNATQLAQIQVKALQLLCDLGVRVPNQLLTLEAPRRLGAFALMQHPTSAGSAAQQPTSSDPKDKVGGEVSMRLATLALTALALVCRHVDIKPTDPGLMSVCIGMYMLTHLPFNQSYVHVHVHVCVRERYIYLLFTVSARTSVLHDLI